ncbi:MAG: DEAD/DEAH box helicase family protein [Candidatus Thorarchaeota archaeon]|nr:DEAD/DEAH box helicase family protein [Candidatus Thorarchaeota archaeon]
MTETKSKYTPRGYQEYLLDRIVQLKGTNLLLELDCGLGKRFITHQIITKRFPDLKFIIVVHSSSSLVETVDYLRGEYGGLDDELGELSSRVPSRRRVQMLEDNRIIVSTPQVLAGMLQKHLDHFESFDAVLINEVDTLIRRTSGRTTLIFPWPTILSLTEGKWIIGMSGTLRDDHAVFNEEQIEIRRELVTLQKHIRDAVVISMDELYGTDVEDFLEPTLLKVEPVADTKIRSIAHVIDEIIRDTRGEIRQQLDEEGNLHLIGDDVRRIHLMLERLPIDDELKGRYSGLLMLRKYIYAMPPHQFLRMFRGKTITHYFDVAALRRTFPKVSSKTWRVVEIAKDHTKTLVLTSYLEMVSQIKWALEKAGLQALTITGQTRNARDVLRQFREDVDARVLVLSPVGERDLDIPQAEVMVVCDTINTTKTMYQKFKRTRGGLVVLLVYQGTYEERKAHYLLKSVAEKYPWSVTIAE